MMRSFSLALVAMRAQAGQEACTAGDIQGFFDTLFSSLGNDCEAYIELFAESAQYYHQHDGHKTYSELQANCEGFAGAFPPGSQAFRQAGNALMGSHDGDECHFLVPYIWSAIPAQEGMPHTGWEYIIAIRDDSLLGYKMTHFAEIETTFTVPFNWYNPRDTPALFSESTLAELHLTTSDTTDACDAPLASTLTDFLQQEGVRQQGDAVALAAGGLCQVSVPFASEVDGDVMSGYFVLQLQKDDDSYRVRDSSKFDAATEFTLQTGSGGVRICDGAKSLFDALFSSLGNDCEKYMELFAEGAQYYHQHDGHKTYSELQANCEGFAVAFPPGSQVFRQAGEALVGPQYGDVCQFLVPYIWSAIPAQDGMPHTGWEYIVATRDHSRFGYKINHFAEIETTFTVPFNWHSPRDTPVLFRESTLAELHITTSDTTDACDKPLANILTDSLQQLGVRQQGDAVALAAGGLCQVSVPFAQEVGGALMSGYVVLVLENAGNGYRVRDNARFDNLFERSVTVPQPMATV